MDGDQRRRGMTAWRPAAFAVLREPYFASFLLALGASELGFFLRMTTRDWLVLELTDSQLWVGLAGGIGAVPIVILAAMGGAVSDMMDRRRTVMVAWMVQAVLSFSIAYLITAGLIQAWHLLLFSIAFGATMAFDAPALLALVVDLARGRRVFAANGLFFSTATIAAIAGPPVAGYLIAAHGIDTAYYAVGAAIVASVVLMWRVRAPAARRSAAAGSVFASIAAGLAYARRTPPIAAVLAIVMTRLVAGFIMPLIPVYARDVLGVGVSGFGVLMALHAIGFLVGSAAASLVGDVPRKGLIIVGTAVAWDVLMVAFGFSRSFPLSVGLLFVMGIAAAAHENAITTTLQLSAAEHIRGRIMSLYHMADASFPLGFILGGALAAGVGNELALVLGAVVSTPVLLLIYARSPALRQR